MLLLKSCRLHRFLLHHFTSLIKTICFADVVASRLMFLFRARSHENKCLLRSRLFSVASCKKGSVPISLYQKEKDRRFLWPYTTPTISICQYLFWKIFQKRYWHMLMVGVVYGQRKRRSFSFWYKEIGTLPFLQLATENKRLRSRHLFSCERARNKNISREATTSAKQMVFMSEVKWWRRKRCRRQDFKSSIWTC